MYVFVVGMERCGTHSVTNIIKHTCKVPHHVVHEESPLWCREAQLFFDGEGNWRTPDFWQKVRNYRKLHKTCKLVCEANHRLSFFITTLARQFPGCKIIFLVRDPLNTIVSKIGTWAHWESVLDKYPEEFRKAVIDIPVHKREFNTYRISPPCPKNLNLHQLYTYEWLETYMEAKRQLALLPSQQRLVMMTEDITPQFRRILDFIGSDLFEITEDKLGWTALKADSIYVQEKKDDRDVFQTQGRSLEDPTVKFARSLVNANRHFIVQEVLARLASCPQLEGDLIDIDNKVTMSLKAKLL